MAEKIVDREGFTTTKAKPPKPQEVEVPNYARYEGITFCKPHGINISYCKTCQEAAVAKAAKAAEAKAAKANKTKISDIETTAEAS